MRVIVAGGAGFIGGHVCRTLLERGHEVTCVDNLVTGSRRTVEALATNPRFRMIEADVSAAPVLDAEVILHLASPASPVDYDRLPLETLAANSTGTWRLLEIARETGARLTYTSTSEIYGDPLVHPQPEGYWGNVDPVGPRSCYDEAKRFGEALISSMRRVHGVRATIVRLFNTYGPGMRADDGRAIPEMISAALEGRDLVVHGDGRQTRSFCYVDDLVAGLLLVALDPAADGDIVNIGNPDEITIRDLATEIIRVSGSGSRLRFDLRRPGDPERRRPDISRISERYGWRPEVGLEAGLRDTIAWFTERRTASSPATSGRREAVPAGERAQPQGETS
jgi:nucleoside-diphosphate-sugar epimerase